MNGLRSERRAAAKNRMRRKERRRQLPFGIGALMADGGQEADEFAKTGEFEDAGGSSREAGARESSSPDDVDELVARAIVFSSESEKNMALSAVVGGVGGLIAGELLAGLPGAAAGSALGLGVGVGASRLMGR